MESKLTVIIPEKLHRDLKITSVKTGKPIKEIVRDAITSEILKEANNEIER